jgi:hypothetical protein
MRRWKVGWDWPAQKWCYPHPKFVVVLFRNCHATHPRVPSPPIRGRRWPTGRMRGHSGTAAYEKIPLTLPSPPNRLRRCCVIALVAATQTIWGERGHFRTVRTAQIRDKEDLTKSNTFAQPRVGPASECERRPTNRSPANGGPARLSCRLSHPAKSLHNAL